MRERKRARIRLVMAQGLKYTISWCNYCSRDWLSAVQVQKTILSDHQGVQA